MAEHNLIHWTEGSFPMLVGNPPSTSDTLLWAADLSQVNQSEHWFCVSFTVWSATRLSARHYSSVSKQSDCTFRIKIPPVTCCYNFLFFTEVLMHLNQMMG
jgi:hypothetical protein